MGGGGGGFIDPVKPFHEPVFMNIFTLLPDTCAASSVSVPQEHVVSITQKLADCVVDDVGANVSNEQVLAISQQCSTVSDAVGRIQKCLDIANLTDEHVRMKLHRTKKKIANLKRNKRTELVTLELQKPFHQCDNSDIDSTNISPLSILSDEDKMKLEKIQTVTRDIVNENRSLKRSLKDVQSDNTLLETSLDQLEMRESILLDLQHGIVDKQNRLMHSYGTDLERLRKENKDWSVTYENLSSQLDVVVNQLSKAKETLSQNKIRNMSKKMKRRDDRLDEQEQQLSEKDLAIAQMTSELEKFGMVNEKIKTEKVQLQKRLSYTKQKLVASEKARETDVQNINSIMLELKGHAKTQDNKIQELEDINTLLESKSFETFEDGKYVNILRETVMHLLTECNVSVGKVNKVIQTVMGNLVGKLPTRLPSRGCLSRILVEAKAVAAQQVTQAMLDGADVENFTGNCLHMDATTKYHHHYQGYEVT